MKKHRFGQWTFHARRVSPVQMVRTENRTDLPPGRTMGLPGARGLSLALPLWGEANIATRIQLGAMPTMLGEIVMQMLGNAGAVINGPSGAHSDPLRDARESGAKLLVVQADPGGEGTIDQIFALPDLQILMISSDGSQGRLVSFAQQPVTLDRDSMAALVLQVAGHA